MVRSDLEFFQSLLDGIEAPVVCISPDRIVQMINEEALELLGISRENAKGQIYPDLFQIDDYEWEECAAFRALKEKRKIERETIVHVHRNDIPIRSIASPLFDDSGSLIGVVEYIVVLTDQKVLLNDISSLAKAIIEGHLNTQIDVTVHHGDFRKIVECVNAMLDAIISPLNVAAEYIDRIGKGDIPPKISEEYRGDFNEIKNNLNLCIDAIQLLIDDSAVLANAAQEGRLDVRCDASKLQGDYRVIIEGVNKTLDAIISPLNVAAEYIDRIGKGDIPPKISEEYRGDFNEIKNNLNLCIDAIQLLIDDSAVLANACHEGQLDVRCDASKLQGAYRVIIEGVNRSLESVIVQIKETLRVAKEYANLNFTARVNPSLRMPGDWLEFKNALDNIGLHVSTAIGLVNTILHELTASAEEAMASIQEVSAGAQQIAVNTGKVSSNSYEGEDGIHQVLKAMDDLNITVAEVARRADVVSSTATLANGYAKNGVDLAQKSDTAMEEIKRSTAEADQIVKDINTQMEEIGKIVRLISDIANQTNLLALNAAIEAARAGEAGRGFAVVAAEVKSLAQDSRQSAENIADMITALQNKATKANDAMGHAGETVALGSSALSDTLKAFEQIATSIDEITRNITDVASSAEEQAASVEEVTSSIHEVSVLVQNTAKEAGDAAAATEEISASIDQVSKVFGNVNEIVEKVSNEVMKFKV